jgi:hypothetical protein
LVGYNIELEDRKGTLGSTLLPVTFTTSYCMLLTQRVSRRRDMHKRITMGRDFAEVAARGRGGERRSEDIKD